MRSDRQPTLLIAHPDRQQAIQIEEWFADKHSTQVTTTGKELLEAYDETVDVVLLSHQLPDMPVETVFERLQTTDVEAQIGLIADTSPEEWDTHLAFDALIQTPVNRGELQDVVERLFLRNTYDEQIQALYTISAKLGSLESGEPLAELEHSDEYQSLKSRQQQLRRQADAVLEAFPQPELLLQPMS